MPSLDRKSANELLGNKGKCPVCKKDRYKSYCNSCDEFIFKCTNGCRCNDTAHDSCGRRTF